MKEQRCAEKIKEKLQERLDDLRKLWNAYCKGEEEVEDLGSLYDYGLCFDYVPSGTFDDQEEPYFRYQLSWGGPSDEFRFYCGPDKVPYRIEYWYLDWFDGANIILKGRDEELLLEIFDWFAGSGLLEQAINQAR